MFYPQQSHDAAKTLLLTHHGASEAAQPVATPLSDAHSTAQDASQVQSVAVSEQVYPAFPESRDVHARVNPSQVAVMERTLKASCSRLRSTHHRRQIPIRTRRNR